MSAISAMASNLSGQVRSLQTDIQAVQRQLASGKKLLNAGESGQVTRLSAQVIGYNQAVKNIGQAQNVIGIAQTGLTSIASMLDEMQQIAIQATSAGLQASDRSVLNDTFQNLMTQASSQVRNSSLNGANLLDGVTGSDLLVQSGNTSNEKTTVANLGIDHLFNVLNQGVGPLNASFNSGLTGLYDAAADAFATYNHVRTFTANVMALTGTDPVTLAIQSAPPAGGPIIYAASAVSGVDVETISGVFYVESAVCTATDLNAAKTAVAALTRTDPATLAAQAAAR